VWFIIVNYSVFKTYFYSTYDISQVYQEVLKIRGTVKLASHQLLSLHNAFFVIVSCHIVWDTKFGDRAIAICGPLVWNSLLMPARNSSLLSSLYPSSTFTVYRALTKVLLCTAPLKRENCYDTIEIIVIIIIILFFYFIIILIIIIINTLGSKDPEG